MKKEEDISLEQLRSLAVDLVNSSFWKKLLIFLDIHLNFLVRKLLSTEESRSAERDYIYLKIKGIEEFFSMITSFAQEKEVEKGE